MIRADHSGAPRGRGEFERGPQVAPTNFTSAKAPKFQLGSGPVYLRNFYVRDEIIAAEYVGFEGVGR